MTLDRPIFVLSRPNPSPTHITDAEWWLWERLLELEPTQSALGGIYANKRGFHNTGNANEVNWPGNYSIRDAPNRRGPWWRTRASALDWIFNDAKWGNYTTIAKYSKRLLVCGRDPNDPRLDLILFEFFGQADGDTYVEGFNEYRDQDSTSDSSHLWHIHLSFLRDRCGDFWAMWALLTVLMGWTVERWRASLTQEGALHCKFGDGEKPSPPSEAVLEMQLDLTDAGADLSGSGGADGRYGPGSAGAQVAVLGAGIAGDGKVYGARQRNALQKLLRGKGEKGDPGQTGPPGKTPTRVRISSVDADVIEVA